MNNLVYILCCLLIGYSAGCLNPAYFISKMKGFDIRERGSGNAGGSNAMMILGKAAGLVCVIFDIAKAYLSVKISATLFPLFKLSGIIAGAACILGHIFPITMKFHGGKGLASLAGVALAYDVKVLLILLVIEAVIALTLSYICVVATSGSVLFSIVLFLKDGPVFAMIFFPVVVSIWFKHVINFKRIRKGVEVKVSYLWNKKKEEERVRNNWNRLTQQERIDVNLLELN